MADPQSRMTHRDSTASHGERANSSTSTSLLGRAKAGEDQAWRRLVALYSPLVYEWYRRQGLQAEDAGDVAQEVFAAVARSIEGFRRDRPNDSFRGWLWTITRNKIRDHFRNRKGQPGARGGTDAQMRLAELPEQPPDASVSSLPGGGGDSLQRRAIELVRAGVEERTWQAFWRVAVEGEAVAAVAQQLGISVQAVYDAKYRIRRKIRQEFDGLIE
ncbi:MAG: sigma-70 family RNA polymerase sigma factor [Planctomycetia bacterium]|nr:sigma-70 family RNA polymerase sigma factor [Planctomycetia bacterium]